MTRRSFTVVGGGPVGALTSILLARHGYVVSLYEGRPDSRETSIYQGRSINIALSDRGWTSLQRVGIDDTAKSQSIPMNHRAIHAMDGSLTRLPYGKEDDAIWSVSRAGINEQLLDICEQQDNLHLNFEHRLTALDFESATATFETPADGNKTVQSDFLFGADGARSKVRRLAHRQPRFSYSQSYMPQCYIELHIPANDDGSHKLEKNALHIWPRGRFMLIALPNPDGTFTCTLFLNFEGEPSFESLQNHTAAAEFFNANFSDAMDLLEDPVETFLEREAAPLFLVQVFPWSFYNRVGLIGDAAHAIVPFYGQGMNSGFEDCAELNDLIANYDHDWLEIFRAYEQSRKPNADAIAELSKRNFVEMSDLSGDKYFQLRKQIEAKFSELFPDLWTPLYSMVTFSPQVPYSEALRVGDQQNAVMEQIMALPEIESDWDQEYVMEKLHSLAVQMFGEVA